MSRSPTDSLDNRICVECAANPSIVAKSVCPHSPLLTNDPLLGTLITDRYKILSVIGVGGWSTVYKADDLKLNRKVAIKILHLHLCVDQDKLQRFRREAEAASALTHANISIIYDTGILPTGRPFIVMELVEGKSLTEVILEKRPLAELIGVFRQSCEGLDAIHKLGLVHRDLKPSNIIVSDAGVAKILDFGLAKWILQDDLLTRTEETIGTPSYMSPEQCTGTKIDFRCDIYALGCIMYESVTGVRAFPYDNTLVCMQKQIQSMPPSFSRVRSDLKVPRTLEHLIFKALAKDPRDRFASVKALQAALERYDQEPTMMDLVLHKLSLQRNAPPHIRYLILSSGLAVSAMALILVAPMLQKQRTLLFPSGHAVGVLYLVTNAGSASEVRSKVGSAQGSVQVPADAAISLQQVPKKDATTLAFLSSLQPDDLYSLDLYDAPVTVDAVDQINRLSGLKVLSFSRSDVSDEALSKLNLPNLHGFDLSDTVVSDRSLSSVLAMKKLQWLSLAGNTKVTDVSTAQLAKLSCLDALKLSDMPQLTDKSVQALSASQTLSTLQLGADRISNSGLASLAQTKNLHALDLNHTLVTDNGVESLMPLKHLKRLNLSETNITDAAAEPLSKMQNLQSLNISGTKLSASALERLKSKLPHCLFEG